MKTIEITTVVLSQKQANTLVEAGFICGEIVKALPQASERFELKQLAFEAMSALNKVIPLIRTE